MFLAVQIPQGETKMSHFYCSVCHISQGREKLKNDHRKILQKAVNGFENGKLGKSHF